ncbi:Nitrogen metabolite regulation-like protein [Lachnellula occidentalis]|uniref:Nitrogen metabolite regulation-like protein n=1 Tax=Lachnellula occidentalis TaxID=215460 RepID=A0A8H8UHL4_9HELO|nr:Nitrogen metabolite regulation-like protein [Lachnellula occidentalis]
MSSTKTLIFGATGAVGSATARTAQEHGAKVILARRCISKPIPGLTSAQEQAGGFERVQADPLDPDSVRAAVMKSGAKHAFIYAALQSTDYMRATIEIEKNIADIFGPQKWVRVRPGWFASNTSQWKPMIADGKVKILYPYATFELISPEDIGRGCGAITGRQFDPRDAIAAIGKVLGRDIRVTALNEDVGFEKMANHFAGAGVPESATNDAATFFITVLKGRIPGDTFTGCIYIGPAYEEGQNNILECAGQKATTFED